MLGHRGHPGELLEGPGQAGDVVDVRGGREGGWHRQGESHMLLALLLPPLVLMMPILMCRRRNYSLLVGRRSSRPGELLKGPGQAGGGVDVCGGGSWQGGHWRLLLLLSLLVLTMPLIHMCQRSSLLVGRRSSRPGELLEGPGQAGDVIDVVRECGNRQGGGQRRRRRRLLVMMFLPVRSLLLLLPMIRRSLLLLLDLPDSLHHGDGVEERGGGRGQRGVFGDAGPDVVRGGGGRGRGGDDQPVIRRHRRVRRVLVGNVQRFQHLHGVPQVRIGGYLALEFVECLTRWRIVVRCRVLDVLPMDIRPLVLVLVQLFANFSLTLPERLTRLLRRLLVADVDVDAASLVQFQESPSHLTDRGHDSLYILFDTHGSH